MMKRAISILLLAASVGCVSVGNNIWTKKDPWYHAPKDWRGGPYEQPGIPYILVPPAKQSEAESLLQAVPIIELSNEQGQSLVGTLPERKNGTTLFLVRSVVLNEDTGRHSVYYYDGALWVTHNCLGKTPVLMKRRCLVVQLSKRPRQVYVICGMDE